MSIVEPIAHGKAKMKRRATDETRRKQSEAHSGDKHHYFGCERSEETKLKIARTLCSVVRYDFDAVTILPSHMKTVDEVGTIGYMIVGHESVPGKIKFSSKRTLSNEAIVMSLRARCVFYLDHLNACVADGSPPTPKSAYMEGFE